MQNNESRWQRLQRGQALMEYWPVIPAAVGIMIGASILVEFLSTSFIQTSNGLEEYCKPAEVIETTTTIFDHQIEASGATYDPATNRTTVSFTVTSGSQPSISHWILGISKDVANRIVASSEAYSWTDSDPTTGMAGIKFDTGYEGGSGGGKPDNGGSNPGNGGGGGGSDPGNGGSNPGNGGGSGGTDPGNGGSNPGNGGGSGGSNPGNGGGSGGSNPGNGGGKGGKGKVFSAGTVEGVMMQVADGETRVISLTLDGNYDFGTITVTTKAGSDQVGSGTISGPVAVKSDEQNQDGGDDRAKEC